MKKAAFFVEGQTEVIFIKKMIEELAGANNCIFSIEKFFRKGYLQVLVGSPVAGQHQILIVDCASDGSVVTAIVDRYQGLASNNYDVIFGIRDLFPIPRQRLVDVQQAMNAVIPNGPVPVHIVVAIEEVEAWFLQEDRHFSKISPILTRHAINTNLNYDIEHGLAENVGNPALFLKSIYKIAGMTYSKKKSRVERTVSVLDFAYLCYDRSAILSSFGPLVQRVESWILSP